jgi:hypothetical protein
LNELEKDTGPDPFGQYHAPSIRDTEQVSLAEEHALLNAFLQEEEDGVTSNRQPGDHELPEDQPQAGKSQGITPPGTHIVSQGETGPSIGRRYGFKWETIWKDAHNASLREKRTPDLLLPGDRIWIPAKAKRTEEAPTEQRTRFRLKSAKVWLRIVFKDNEDKPRANLDYTLHVEGVSKPLKGKTNAQGIVEKRIPARPCRARLHLHDPSTGPEPEAHELFAQYLDPLDEDSGVRARLNNLSYRIGQVEAVTMTDHEHAAVRLFQIENDLPVTGKLDDATRRALRDAYGC